MFGEQTEAAVTVEPENAQTITLLHAATHIDPNPSKGGGDILVEDGALVADTGPGESDAMTIRENGQISVYVVREGDSLSQIAEMFEVTPNTILWANDIKKASLIKPGDSLIILPISGVRYVLKKADTLASIAKIYAGNVDDIITYNGLSSPTDISVGQTIVIPGGRVPTPPTPKKAAPKKGVGTGSVSSKGPSGGNSYFTHPVPGAVRTQGMHGYNGVDLGAPTGTTVRASAAGEVIISKNSGWNGGFGNYIVIKHPNGVQTLYAHLSTNAVSAGQTVSQGGPIGTVGSTGQSTGPHLHFEVRGDINPF
jgi:LysM repeat protein